MNRFIAGLYTQRSPLTLPLAVIGMRIIERKDAMIAGSNVELSNRQTLIRRNGFSKWNTTQLGASEIPRMYYSDRDTIIGLKVYADLTTTVKYSQGGSGWTAVFNQSAGAGQCFFQRVGTAVYMANGKDALKDVDGFAVWNWGIVAPVTQPGLSFAAGSLSPTSGYTYAFAYKNANTGHISTASPLSANTGPQTSKNITVTGSGSTDTQVTHVRIYRTKDGGSTLYFLADITNVTNWTYTDSTADSGLNTDIQAAIADANDPPPSGITNIAFYSGYMWGSVGNKVYFNAGPACQTGVPEECWPPANVFVFPNTIQRILPSPFGLLIFTADSSYIMYGVDITSFYPQEWLAGLGILTPNAVTTDGQSVYIFSAQGQFLEIGGDNEELGFSIGPQLDTFNPANVYVSVHRSGSADAGIYISDGSSQIARYSLTMQGWSAIYTVQGGCGAIRSCETSTGVYSLLMGRTSGSGYVLKRDLTTYTDDGTAYTCSATFGSFVLATSGTVASVDALYTMTTNVGSQPTVGILANDTSGSFITLPVSNPDPWQIPSGTGTIAKQYPLKGAASALPQVMQHFQFQLTWPAENFGNELLGFAAMPIQELQAQQAEQIQPL